MRHARMIAAVLVGLLMAAFSASPSLADKRVALVIGNAAYRANIPQLKNPANDAPDLAEELKALGFEVVLRKDAGIGAFNDALAEFSRKAAGADAVLFFYAGHGLQYEGQNYFLPIDIDVRDAADVEYKAIAMDKVLGAVNKSDGVKIVILDACRDNPLAKQLATRSIGGGDDGPTRGLARIEKTKGLIIAYATAPNEVALDGAGRNSPFTEALINRLKEPGVEVGMIFRRITADVIARTDGRQRPELSISLGGEYYLNQSEGDSLVWNRIRRSQDPAELQDFIRRFPSSPYVRDAQDRLDLFERIRVANEERLRQEAEAQRLEAKRLAEERIAAEKAKAEAETKRLAEERSRLEAEKARAEAEAKRVADERAAAEKAKAEAESKRLAEERSRLEAEKARAEAEAKRVADERAAAEKASADAEEKRRAKEHLAAEDAKAKAAAEQARQAEAEEKRRIAEACARESEELRRLGADRRLDALEEFAKHASCPTLAEAVDRERRNVAASIARACKDERNRVAAIKPDDVEGLRSALPKLTCEALRDELSPRIARLDQEAEQKAKLCAESFGAIDAGALDAAERYAAFQKNPTCSTLRPQVGEALAKLTQRVKDAQAELKRLSCYGGSAHGLLDEGTKKAIGLYLTEKGGNAASPRMTDDFVSELRSQKEAVCPSAAPIASAPEPSKGAETKSATEDAHRKAESKPVAKAPSKPKHEAAREMEEEKPRPRHREEEPRAKPAVVAHRPAPSEPKAAAPATQPSSRPVGHIGGIGF